MGHAALELNSARGVPVSDLIDGAAALVAALTMFTALTFWFIAVVPLQYFIVLIAGGPARLALKLNRQATAPGVHQVDERGRVSEIEKWEGNLLAAPVDGQHGHLSQSDFPRRQNKPTDYVTDPPGPFAGISASECWVLWRFSSASCPGASESQSIPRLLFRGSS